MVAVVSGRTSLPKRFIDQDVEFDIDINVNITLCYACYGQTYACTNYLIIFQDYKIIAKCRILNL